MLKRRIEPFNKIWIDCDTNRTMSLLTYSNEKYEILAYLNDYEYYTGLAFIDGFGFDYITVEKKRIISQRYCKRIFFCESIESENYFEEIKLKLAEGKYIIAAVDLFYLIEGNLCYGKYHWPHYTMITDYLDETKCYTIFDDKNSTYISYEIKEEALKMAICNADLNPKMYAIEMKSKYEFSNITAYDIVENAYATIRSIKTGLDKTFWKLRKRDYERQEYMDLEALHLKEIESRQISNSCLMTCLKDFVICDKKDTFELYSEQFMELSKKWGKIRQLLYRLYLSEKHEEYLEKINARTQSCLMEEERMWYEIARYIMNECEDISIDFNFTN